MAVDITTAEISLHVLFFFVAVVTPFIMYGAYRRFKPGAFKTLAGFFTLAYIFTALGWIGGTLSYLRLPVTKSTTFVFIWVLAVVLAVVFAVYAANLMHTLSQKTVARRR